MHCHGRQWVKGVDELMFIKLNEVDLKDQQLNRSCNVDMSVETPFCTSLVEHIT